MAVVTRDVEGLASETGVAPGSRGTISGIVFQDYNENGRQDAGERGLKFRHVFLDANHNGVEDDGERFARTGADGSYTIKRVAAGDYDVVASLPDRWHATSPSIPGDFYSFNDLRYRFVEIAKTGDALVFDDADDGYASYAAPRGVTFYGQSYTDLHISVNGFLTLASDPTDPARENQHLPSAAAPNDLIAPLWDDYMLGRAGKVFVMNDFHNDRLIIEWKNVVFKGEPSGPTYTFEAVLNDNGVIKFVYKDVSGDGTATVGVENATGTVATEISYNQPAFSETAYYLTPHDTVYGIARVHVDAGADLTGVNFGQIFNSPALPFDPSVGAHGGEAVALHDHASASWPSAVVHLA